MTRKSLFECLVCGMTGDFHAFESGTDISVVHIHVIKETEKTKQVFTILQCANCESIFGVTVGYTKLDRVEAEELEKEFHEQEQEAIKRHLRRVS